MCIYLAIIGEWCALCAVIFIVGYASHIIAYTDVTIYSMIWQKLLKERVYNFKSLLTDCKVLSDSIKFDM